MDPAGSATKLLPSILKPLGTWLVDWLAGFRSPQTLALRRYQKRLADKYQQDDYLPLRVEDAGRKTRVEQVITDRKHVVVAGEPGAGKSALLKHLAFEFAKGGRRTRKEAIPVLVKLLDVARNDVDACVLKQLRRAEFFRAEKFLARALDNGKLRVLLDGLDEVPREDRGHTVRRVLAFIEEYGDCEVVVTCRSAVRERALWDRMHAVTVAEFDDELIKQFIRARLGVNGSRTQELLFDNPRALALARVPLLLKMMIEVTRVPGASIPITSSRAQFYREAVDHLLSPRNAEASSDPEHHRDMKDVLRTLSLTGKDSGSDVLDRETAFDHAMRVLADSNSVNALFLDITRSGLLRHEGDRRYRFGHLSFQDYLAADALDADGLLTRLDLDPDRWQETAILWCGFNDATKVVRHLLANGSLAALECLGEAETVADDVARAVLDRFAPELDGAAADSQVVRAFGVAAAGRSAVFEFLRDEVTNPGSRRAAAAHALAISGLPEAVEVLGGLYRSTPDVREPLVRMGDPAVATLGDMAAMNGLAGIATPAALRVLVGFLWRDDEQAARAAWRIAAMISDPQLEAALAGFEAPHTSILDYGWVWMPFTGDRTTLTIINRVSELILYGPVEEDRQIDKRLAIALGFVDAKLTLTTDAPPSKKLVEIAGQMHTERPPNVVADQLFEVREDEKWCDLQRRFFDEYLKWRRCSERRRGLLRHVPLGDVATLMVRYRYRTVNRSDEWINMGRRSPGLVLMAIVCGTMAALAFVTLVVLAVVQTARTFFPGGAFSLDAVPWLRSALQAVADGAGWLWHLGPPALVPCVLGVGALCLGWALRRQRHRIAAEIVGGTVVVVGLVLLALLVTMPMVWSQAAEGSWLIGGIYWMGAVVLPSYAMSAILMRRDRLTSPLRDIVATREPVPAEPGG
ncbi:NACHT domain-containing protein [Actinophytocola sp.]|uniref:NACHT domain-containing protein n=1 Tax=Actinophytocola sp. TaxID=1872138 RepID=UPI002ED37E81